jgi:hypothetical protein
MSGVQGVAVQADLQPDTAIAVRPPSPGTETRTLSLGDYSGRIDIYGTEEQLRRLAATILAALPDEEETS